MTKTPKITKFLAQDCNKDGYAKGGKTIKATNPSESQTVIVRGNRAIRPAKRPVKATWY
jgi:hypothetical protein